MISSIMTLEKLGALSMPQREIKETAEQLFERIKPAFIAVDIDHLSDEVLDVIYMTELSGTPASDDFKRLMTLKKDGLIDSDEARVLIVHLAKIRHAA